MQELNQGEEYEELTDDLEQEPQYEDEGEEDTESNSGKLFGLPIKAVIVGGAILVIVILGLVLLVARKFSSSDEDETAIGPTEVYETVEVYDETGNVVGTCDGVTDGFMIMSSDGAILGYIDSTNGTVAFYDSSGTQLGMYSPNDTPVDTPIDTPVDTPVDEPVDTPVDSMDGSIDSSNPIDDTANVEFDEDNVRLRQAGYTGDEIEMVISMGLDINDLVKKAEKEQQKALEKRLKKVSNKKSKEFIKLYENSIFCLDELKFDSFDDTASNGIKYESNYVVNADYWKVPTYGHQLYIKCKIANNTYSFYNVTPERWQTLPEEGNIVLRIDYTMYGTNTVNMYITNIEEIDTTKITVNALDSGSALDDILQDSAQDSGVVDEEGDVTGTEEEGSDGSGINDTW